MPIKTLLDYFSLCAHLSFFSSVSTDHFILENPFFLVSLQIESAKSGSTRKKWFAITNPHFLIYYKDLLSFWQYLTLEFFSAYKLR